DRVRRVDEVPALVDAELLRQLPVSRSRERVQVEIGLAFPDLQVARLLAHLDRYADHVPVLATRPVVVGVLAQDDLRPLRLAGDVVRAGTGRRVDALR